MQPGFLSSRAHHPRHAPPAGHKAVADPIAAGVVAGTSRREHEGAGGGGSDVVMSALRGGMRNTLPVAGMGAPLEPSELIPQRGWIPRGRLGQPRD
jgi:hypothetical protein